MGNGPWSKQAPKQQNDGRRSSHGPRPNGHAHEYGCYGSCPSRNATQCCQPSRYRPNFKYTSGVRNVAGAPVMPAQPAQAPMPPQQPQQQQPPQAAVFIQGQEPLTASMLAQAPPSEQKQMLGERLFPLIQSMFPELAGKITGMLLEIDNSELVHMLEHNESLKGKVDEA